MIKVPADDQVEINHWLGDYMDHVAERLTDWLMREAEVATDHRGSGDDAVTRERSTSAPCVVERGK